MDKKMQRQILFRKDQTISENLEDRANQVTKINTAKSDKKPKIEPKEKIELTTEQKSKALYKWLESHPLVNLNGVCLEVGVDRANFVKGMSKKKILKEDILIKFQAALKEYGFSI